MGSCVLRSISHIICKDFLDLKIEKKKGSNYVKKPVNIESIKQIKFI